MLVEALAHQLSLAFSVAGDVPCVYASCRCGWTGSLYPDDGPRDDAAEAARLLALMQGEYRVHVTSLSTVSRALTSAFADCDLTLRHRERDYSLTGTVRVITVESGRLWLYYLDGRRVDVTDLSAWLFLAAEVAE